jgi:hypothetical protein
MARLEPIKDRINISQICREALERRIVTFEGANGHLSEELDLEGLVKRLREERDLVEGKFERLGRNNAAAWLKAASLLEIKGLAEDQNSLNMKKYRLPQTAFRIMKQDMEDTRVNLEGGQAMAYKTAWLDYVRTVWATVVNQLTETKAGEPVAGIQEQRHATGTE